MKDRKKAKVPEYTLKAIERYNAKNTRITVILPNELKARMDAIRPPELTPNKYICLLILQEIERQEKNRETDTGNRQEEQETPPTD